SDGLSRGVRLLRRGYRGGHRRGRRLIRAALSDGRHDLEELEPADDRQEGEHRQEHEQHSFFHRSSVYSRGVTLTGVERLRFREFQCCTAFGEVKANGRPGPMRLTSSFCELVTHYLPLSFDRSATQLK